MWTKVRLMALWWHSYISINQSKNPGLNCSRNYAHINLGRKTVLSQVLVIIPVTNCNSLFSVKVRSCSSQRTSKSRRISLFSCLPPPCWSNYHKNLRFVGSKLSWRLCYHYLGVFGIDAQVWCSKCNVITLWQLLIQI